MKLLFSLFLFCVAMAIAPKAHAQTGIPVHYPVSGGDTTLYPPAGMRYATAPVSVPGMTASVATDGSACHIHTNPNTGYTPLYYTWYFTCRPIGSPTATLTISYYVTQDAYVPPPFSGEDSSLPLLKYKSAGF